MSPFELTQSLQSSAPAGWPTFVQEGVPFAHQPFQIESTLPGDVNFGAVGAERRLLTAKRDVRFSWASH